MRNQELYAMLFYLVVMVSVGIYFFMRNRKNVNGEKEYFLGGRKMNAWVSALSAGASDMSAWVLMGLPGAIYLSGVNQVWIPVGLLLGTIAMWVLVAPRLRRYSILANDSITIPQFLANRFLSANKSVQVISAVVFLLTYCVYAASSIYACGILFNKVLGMNPSTAMIIASIVIVVYTFLGGFNAVCWTDFFQGMMMLAALMLAPIIAAIMMTRPEFVAPGGTLPPNYFNPLATGMFDQQSIVVILSGLGWGLGYFGMPHILVRFLAVKSEKEMRRSQIIGCCWIFVILSLSAVVGLLGRNFLAEKLTAKTSELVFVNMVRAAFDWVGTNIGMVSVVIFITGILLSAILAASMSTADSQLLASASAFASDMYKPLLRKNASEKEMLWAGRIIVVIIAVVAYLIANSPSCGGIMGLVSCAWAAFGSAFGPVMLLALYWKRFTYSGAVAGIVAGFLVDALWYVFMAHTGLYEIIPGFLAGFIAAVLFSLWSKEPSQEVVELFEKSKLPLAETPAEEK